MKRASSDTPSGRARRKPQDAETYHFMCGVLAALDLLLVGHDEPTIAADVIRASGPEHVMQAARRSGYPFMRQLRKVYRQERLND